MGGPNGRQLIEHVHSSHPRGWSCLHVDEGSLLCHDVIVQHNDIGPCGKSIFMQWSDGLSISCRSAVVYNNTITDPTDGGIVLFGAPFSKVYRNTIRVSKVRYTSVYHFDGVLSPV